MTKDRIGGEEKDLLKAADEALAKGDAAGAADLYAQVLAQDSANVAALAGLARSYVRTGAIEQAKQTLALVPEAKRNDAAVAAARAALELAEQAKSVGPISELEQKVAANPLDHQARFDLAVALNSKGRRAEAVDQSHRDRQARPQMERRRRAQAARPVLRGLGADRRGHRERAQAAFVDPVLVSQSGAAFARRACVRWRATMPMNAVYAKPADLAT